MKLLNKFIEHRKNRLAEKYKEWLLNGDIRLADVPSWLRQDYRRCYPIYITAFRIDRSTSKEHFAEDLFNLECEIELAKEMRDTHQVNLLTRIFELESHDFEVFFLP